MEASERLHRLAKDALEEYNKGVAAGGEPIYPAWADDMFVVHTLLKRKAFAFDEWLEKTNWVQEQIKTFPLASLGKHRADVLREEIERLRLITHVDHDQLAAIRAGLDAAAQAQLSRQQAAQRVEDAAFSLATSLSVIVENGGIGPEDMFDEAREALAEYAALQAGKEQE